MDKFFNSENPVMRFLSRLVDLVMLNVITLIYCLPLITAGGALTAMNYVLLHLHRGDESYIIRMFRKSFRENFRQGIPEGLLALAAAGITAVDLWALHGSGSRAATLMMIVITIIAVMIFVTCVYMFALQSRYENKVSGTILNAVRLAIGNLPTSVGMAAIWLIWIAILVFLYRAAPLFFLIFGLTMPGYLCTMLYNRIFEDLESEEE
ncbi:MAG: YesL family protein [Mogibacterium sp.]|nr:YesL family protein [Mogibacterium sp.]